MSDIPFIPPAPVPRSTGVTTFEMMRIIYRNPLELWGEPAYEEPWIVADGATGPLVIANDPGLVRHVLLDNVKNYRMGALRQRVLRPILRDGLLTAEGDVWRRSRRALAPVFTPRNITGFAEPMLDRTRLFAERYAAGGTFDIAGDMTMLTYDILAQTLFSGEIAGDRAAFARETERLFETMGRVDPLDLFHAPEWLPRLTRLRGRRALAYFRKVVADTIEMRRERLRREAGDAPRDFLTLLLEAEGPDGLSRSDVEDNIITFIGAGHETTARALGWTLYCLASASSERAPVEREIDGLMAAPPHPSQWPDLLPLTRAAFEEALRLYPPAPSINRQAVEADVWGGLVIPKGATVLVMPWIIHRHRKYWERPEAFIPSRFHPARRAAIDRFQFLPFGVGPRICIGATFAMQEAMIVLAVLLAKYRFETTAETKPWPVQRLTTQPEGGLPMRVVPR